MKLLQLYAYDSLMIWFRYYYVYVGILLFGHTHRHTHI